MESNNNWDKSCLNPKLWYFLSINFTGYFEITSFRPGKKIVKLFRQSIISYKIDHSLEDFSSLHFNFTLTTIDETDGFALWATKSRFLTRNDALNGSRDEKKMYYLWNLATIQISATQYKNASLQFILT